MVKKIKYSFYVCLKNHYTCICCIYLHDLHTIHFFCGILGSKNMCNSVSVFIYYYSCALSEGGAGWDSVVSIVPMVSAD